MSKHILVEGSKVKLRALIDLHQDQDKTLHRNHWLGKIKEHGRTKNQIPTMNPVEVCVTNSTIVRLTQDILAHMSA